MKNKDTSINSRIALIISFCAVFSIFYFVKFSSITFFQDIFFQKPEVIFIPGMGLKPGDYQSTIDAIKEVGFDVITYTPNYEDPHKEAKMIFEWTKGISNLIGTKKVIVIGHSVGGAVATYFCSTDPRCIKGINLDGGPIFDTHLNVPFLYIQGGIGGYCDEHCLAGRTLMEKITKQSNTKIIKIPEIKHYNFTDLRSVDLYEKDELTHNDGRYKITNSITTFLAN